MDPKDIIIEQVKTFSPEVAEAISVFVTQLGDSYQPFTDDSLREIIASPQSYLFVAIHVPTKEVAGMVMEAVYRIPYTTKAYIDDVFIDEKFRGLGIATKLMQKAVILAREKHASYIDCTAKPSRVAGNSLYEKLGFKKRDTNVYRLRFTYEEV